AAPPGPLCGARTRRIWDASRDGPWRGALYHPFVPPGRLETVVEQQLTENAELFARLAERGGFEPPIRLPVCRISSAVHSTALPPLRRGRAQGPRSPRNARSYIGAS